MQSEYREGVLKLVERSRDLLGERLRARMAALGSRRRSYLGHPYWDLKPDWKPGDVIDL